MGILFAVLGWFFTFVAVFIGIGDPAPGPDLEQQRELKTTLLFGALGLTWLFFGAALYKAARGWRTSKIQSMIAVFGVVFWVVAFFALFSAETR
jgi:hypothetical protein